MQFIDRKQAGGELAEILEKYKAENPLVLALPRGGVVTGYAIAEKLCLPLGVVIVRKLSAPGNPEFGIGGLAQDGTVVWDKNTADLLGLSKGELERIKRNQEGEIKRRLKLYQAYNFLDKVKGRIVILVDDGLATGVTARTAIAVIKKNKPKKLVFAAPVCALETFETLKKEVDDLICLEKALEFLAVGTWYQHFEQVSDQEVLRLLQASEKIPCEERRFQERVQAR